MILLLAAMLAQDAPAILARAIPLEAEVNRAAKNYLCKEEKEDQQLDKQGRPTHAAEHRTFEFIALEGEPYRKLVKVEGKPLKPAEQKKVDADLEKTRTERQKTRRLTPTHIERRVKLDNKLETLAASFENSIAGEEGIQGRPAWIIDSKPKDPSAPWSHRSWFDKETGIRLQWTDTVIKDVNGFKTGSNLTFRRAKLPDGSWILEEIVANVEFNAYRVIHGRVRTTQHYSDFRKFEVDTRISPVE